MSSGLKIARRPACSRALRRIDMECGGLDTALDGAACRAARSADRCRRAVTCKKAAQAAALQFVAGPPAAHAAGYVKQSAQAR